MIPENVLRITEGRLHTNPAWTIKAFVQNASLEEKESKRLRAKFLAWMANREEDGFCFSRRARKYQLLRDYHWQSNLPQPPRVVGLLVDTDSEGFVNPLITSRSHNGWHVSRNYLPFHAEQIQDCLIKCLGSKFSLDKIVPELISFSIEDRLRELSKGDSMHIAGLLSVIDAMNDYSSAVFEKACAIVTPQGDDLIDVRSTHIKLEAFAREYEKASLLVAPKGFKVPNHLETCFPENVVWRVGSFRELADRLSDIGQLNVFLDPFPLDNAGLREAKNRLRWQCETCGNAAALEFAERLDNSVKVQGNTSLRISQAVHHELRELNRHVGRFAKAISYSETGLQELEKMGTRISSYEEIAIAKTQLAAGLFDGHDFDRGVSLLSPIVKEIGDDSSRVRAEVEIEVRNTLGRLQTINSDKSWRANFDYSISLQQDVDPLSIPRTRCYIVRGLLRNSQLDDARKEIEGLQQLNLAGFSATEQKFFQADLARRERCIWDDQDFENDENTFGGHPLGFYYQATARQPQRDPNDRAQRLERAAEEFRKDIGEFSEGNVLELFSLFVLWRRAVMLTEPELIEEYRDKVKEIIVNEAGPVQQHYLWKVELAEKTGDFEPLFDAVPYF